MNRNVPAVVAFALLVVAVALHFLGVSSAKEEMKALSASAALLQDSVGELRLAVDSLKAQAPGLGEYMSTIGLHAAKLWFAGKAANWGLAEYERAELGEMMEAAEALHARRDSVEVTAVLQSVRQTQLPLLGEAIAGKRPKAFDEAYGQTLAACNGCHRAAGYGFIHVVTPTREPVSNQRWKPEAR